ncbi:FprA family A-type flavoprotein [Bacteroidota bacterium]
MKDDKILNITDDVKWIGILDYDIITFDIVMETQYGTTYNSYFVDADKKTIIETSKEKFKETYLNKINEVVNPEEIEYIVLNHTEPDHSGNLKHLLKIAPNATVVGSGNAIRYLYDMIEITFKSLKVKDGDTIDLGNKTLQFIGAPNLHWPDSMYTYLKEDRLLFTCDSFGAHFCHEDIFDDQVGNYDDAFKYYFDVILKPFSKFMIKAIEKIKPLDISSICPGHGPILRTNWKKIIELSENYSNEYLSTINNADKNIVILYVSAYGYTYEMAKSIANGIKETGLKNIEIIDIENIAIGELESKIISSQGIIVGSPTINQNTLLPIYKLFSVINPIRDKGKIAVSFGSYGWSGEAIKIIDSQLKLLKLNVFREGLAEKFYPHNGKKDNFIELGKEFGLKMMEECN